MTNKLDALRKHSIVVADTGDLESIKRFKPTDSTTNPTLILKAAQNEAYQRLVGEAVAWGRRNGASAGSVTDRLAVNFGAELSRIVPGRVSTEVDADLSFDAKATIGKAKALIADYESRNIGRDRILIKIAATWEGIQAAAELQRDGIDCNLTLLFSLEQAIACADAKVFLISPFVGRILDWHVKAGGGPYDFDSDPGVLFVRAIYAYYAAYGIDTVVMGASFRNTGEVTALAGCDRLTISPQLLAELESEEGTVVRRLDRTSPGAAPPRIDLDEKAFRWRLNEDAMATEKLAEGIRSFAKDLASLRSLVERRMRKAG